MLSACVCCSTTCAGWSLSAAASNCAVPAAVRPTTSQTTTTTILTHSLPASYSATASPWVAGHVLLVQPAVQQADRHALADMPPLQRAPAGTDDTRPVTADDQYHHRLSRRAPTYVCRPPCRRPSSTTCPDTTTATTTTTANHHCNYGQLQQTAVYSYTGSHNYSRQTTTTTPAHWTRCDTTTDQYYNCRQYTTIIITTTPGLHLTAQLQQTTTITTSTHLDAPQSARTGASPRSVHVTRLVSRGQQAECCCPHEVDRAICCWGGLDDVSSYGQGGRHDYSLQLHPISYIIAQQQQTNYNNNTTIGLLLLPHYYYNYGQLQQCLACDHVAEYNI